jgi:hypothetical protein
VHDDWGRHQRGWTHPRPDRARPREGALSAVDVRLKGGNAMNGARRPMAKYRSKFKSSLRRSGSSSSGSIGSFASSTASPGTVAGAARSIAPAVTMPATRNGEARMTIPQTAPLWFRTFGTSPAGWRSTGTRTSAGACRLIRECPGNASVASCENVRLQSAPTTEFLHHRPQQPQPTAGGNFIGESRRHPLFAAVPSLNFHLLGDLLDVFEMPLVL